MTSSLSDADILVQIYNAEFSCASAEAIVEELKSDLKAAKERYDGCVDKLRELARRVRNDSIENRPLFSQIKSDQPPVVIPAPPETEAEQPESNFDPDAWKSEPLSVLANSEGITAKLLEKLAESDVNTLGDLESLRAEIANAQSVWPKGIGEKKVTAIENAIVEWLAKWNAIQQAAALITETGDTETGEVAGQGAGETEASDPEATFGEGYPTEEEWSAMHDETQIAWLNARAVFLKEKAAAHPDGVVIGLANNNPEGTDRDWSAGANAANAGEEIANCELVPGLECDAWLMGWLWENMKQEEE